MYIRLMALGLALQDARARSRRAASGAATPCCLSWADRAPPAPPSAPSPACPSGLRVARARRLLILVVLVCVTFYMCGQVIKTRAGVDRGVQRRCFAARASEARRVGQCCEKARTPLAPARPSGRACERDRYQRLRPVSELRWLRSQALRVRGSDTRCGSASDVRLSLIHI